MILVHHLNNSRSQRVLWLLEEMNLPYEIIRYERDEKTMLAPPALQAIHPLGKSPVLVDDGAILAESGAIIEYLLSRYDKGVLKPAAGTPELLMFTYWLHYAEGSAMPPLLLSLVFSKLAKTKNPFFLRPIFKKIAAQANRTFIGPQLKTHFDFMEKELSQSPWFAGDQFTAADVQMSFPLEAGKMRGAMGPQHPHLNDFLKRIHARPAYQKALAKGGPYDLLS